MKAALISLFVLTFKVLVFNPILEAAASTSRAMTPATGLVGSTKTPNSVACGSSTRRSSRRFAVNSVARKLIPVALPPGCAMLATRPILTGSSLTEKTIGMVLLALLAAKQGRFLSPQSRQPGGEPTPQRGLVAVLRHSRPSGTQPPRLLRHGRPRSGLDEIFADDSHRPLCR